MAARRGRGKTVGTRGAWVALRCGPSTSPLADMWLAVKRLCLFGACGTTGAAAACNAWRCSLGFVPTVGLHKLNDFVVLVMLATWVVADKRMSGRRGPAFDQGAFVLFLLPIYVPYYFLSTRGWRGLLILVAMLLLFLLISIPEALVCGVS